jgi:hypothetical protein
MDKAQSIICLKTNSSPAVNLQNQTSYGLQKHNDEKDIGQMFPICHGEKKRSKW